MPQPYDYTIDTPGVASAYLSGRAEKLAGLASEQSTTASKQKMDIEAALASQNAQIFKDQSRFQNMYQELAKIKDLDHSTQTRIVQDRIAKGEAEGKDMSESKQFLEANPALRKQMYSGMQTIGQELGYLKETAIGRLGDPKHREAWDSLRGTNVWVTDAQIAADPDRFTAKLPSDQTVRGREIAMAEATAKEEAESKKEEARITAAEKREEERIAAAEQREEAKLTAEEQKARIKTNEKRLSELSNTAQYRQQGLATAKKFLTAFEKGASSGAGRSLLQKVPGVWTDQGQFDEELDAFSETAARAKLKELGEIRPTDADVAGMKKAMFGVGRDEATNMQLLNDYISGQEANTQEYKKMLKAKTAGTWKDYAAEPEYVEPAGDVDKVAEVVEVKRKMKDGRVAVFNSNTKEFIRYE
jgi:hypothetical protein